MRPIFSIAKYLFIESVRNKLFAALILTSIIIVSGNFALDFYSQGIQDRIIFDFGSSLASILGAFLCVYLLTVQIRGEIDSKLAYFTLTSETPRSHYIIGKIAGSLVFVIFNLLIIFSEIFLIIYFNSASVSYMSIAFFYIMSLKLSILCSMTAFFAVMCSSVITPALSIFFYVAGHWGSYIHFAAKKSGGGALAGLTDLATGYLIPNFRFFTAEHVATETFQGMAAYLTALTAYTLAVNVILIYASIKIFEKKDI